MKSIDSAMFWVRGDIMVLDILSSIGTILAAVIGIVGVWLNLWDRTRRLTVDFRTIPSFKIYLSNTSLRSVMITKMVCSVNDNVFYVDYFEGLKAICLPPATTQDISIDKSELLNSYCNLSMNILSQGSEKDKVEIVIFDNYGRKYRIKEDITVEMLMA